MLLGDHAVRAVPRPTIDHKAVRSALEDAEPRWEATRYDRGIAAALEMLEQTEGHALDRAIFLIGDLADRLNE